VSGATVCHNRRPCKPLGCFFLHPKVFFRGALVKTNRPDGDGLYDLTRFAIYFVICGSRCFDAAHSA